MASISIVSVSIVSVKVFIFEERIQYLGLPQIPHLLEDVQKVEESFDSGSLLQSILSNNGLIVLIFVVCLVYSTLSSRKSSFRVQDIIEKFLSLGLDFGDVESKLDDKDSLFVEKGIDTYKSKKPLTVSLRIEDGVNGVYYMKDENGNITAVFKPQVEEAFAPQNPKNRVGELNESSPLKAGVHVGDAYIKETAAYLMDHDHFAKVPQTEISTISINEGESPKIGSLQAFVPNVGCAEDFNNEKFNVHDVHAIGLLDARIANLDRHSGNMLVQKSDQSLNLIPIDHGYSLPDYRNLKDLYFEWTNWKQSSIPFTDEEKDYVQRIDISRDAKTLARLGVRDESIMTYVLSNLIVKVAVQNGWNLKRIGEFMQRDILDDSSPSQFECLVKKSIPESFVAPSFADDYAWAENSTIKVFQDFISNFKAYL
jgi:hypothetical protein